MLRSKTAASVQLLFDDEQVARTLERVANIADLPGSPPRLPQSYQVTDELWSEAYDALFRRADRFGAALGKDPDRRAFSLAVKAGVIAADSVASAMFREDLDLPIWIEEVAHAEALAPDAVTRDLLQPRIAELEAKRPGWTFRYHEFQKGAAAIGDRGLLFAGCGAGKTMAAWRWADEIARTRPIGRIVFLYPTRGTAKRYPRESIDAFDPDSSHATMAAVDALLLDQREASLHTAALAENALVELRELAADDSVVLRVLYAFEAGATTKADVRLVADLSDRTYHAARTRLDGLVTRLSPHAQPGRRTLVARLAPHAC